VPDLPDTGIGLSQIIEELAPYIIAWRGYFGFSQTPRVLTNLDASMNFFDAWSFGGRPLNA
jgi:Group II intron, maturase-specific domain